MQLFLCEKPSQARDIAKVLGAGGGNEGYLIKKDKESIADIAVTWAFGHILEQADPAAYGEQYQKWQFNTLPIIPSNWLLNIKPEAKKQFGIIQKLLKQADEVVIATDADREGEVIGREILDYCGYRGKVSRFWTSGLDPDSVKKALAALKTGSQTEKLYQAGLARSRADWLVGMNLSRAYTLSYAAGFGKEHLISIGRIQTPTLNLVVQRDKTIDHFVPYPYYSLAVMFQTTAAHPFKAIWQIPEALKNTDGFCIDKTLVGDLANRIHGNSYTITRADTELKTTPAPLPYSLSALQKDASKRLGISVSEVLEVAQALYEKHKLTSYPRTPCQYLPQSQQADVPQILSALQSLEPTLSGSLNQANPQRNSRVWNDAQVNKHSHHAIIPTTVSHYDLNQLTPTERSVYALIRDRYIAQFLPDYQYEATVIEITAEQQVFKAAGQVPIQQGWKAFLTHSEENDNQENDDKENGNAAKDNSKTPLPKLNQGDTVQAIEAKPASKQTTPPPRFTEASLLEEMRTLSDFLKGVNDEAVKKVLKNTEGLGTEATRAAIIEILLKRGFIDKQQGKLKATDKGKHLIAAIPPDITDPVTTAKWEEALAKIEAGETSSAAFLQAQAEHLHTLIEQARIDYSKRPKSTGKNTADPAQIGQSCPACKKGKLQQRHLKDKPEKRFLGCSQYPKCKHIQWLQ
ncbi:DNA topoisomerase 3 [Stenoxybacter acetivorans]|uniref:DNA topoisomerase 3 n=1 Tax=Stenoxybacter acetivorans TaxID=422441 RepID=UPI00068EDC7F|nr:DNA topoisomerase 3 [Stenoxybacter acetivorans]